MDKPIACAIVPAFEEEDRIAEVLNALTEASLLDEIIVVDDGSGDRTEDAVRRFPNVRYCRNPVNAGKAYSMCVGVAHTTADILFFCDADLIGFTAKHVDDTLRPVRTGEREMMIATRRHFNNRMTLWSGQRALTRQLWDRVPFFYKHGFRIELGLNFFCANYGYLRRPYSQHLKEEKFGWRSGVYKRIWMFGHVVTAYLRYFLVDWNSRSRRRRPQAVGQRPPPQQQGQADIAVRGESL